MKEFYEYIRNHIKTNLPEFKTVELYNNQIFSSNVERSEKAFPYPAVFVEMIIGEVKNRTLGIKDVYMNVVFHFAIEGYQFNHSQNTLDLLDEFDYYMQGFRCSTGPYFSTFMSEGGLLDTDSNNVVEPTLIYSTVWRRTTAFRSLIEHQLEDIEVNGEII